MLIYEYKPSINDKEECQVLVHMIILRKACNKKNMVASSVLLIFVPWTILNRFGPGAIFLTFGIF